MKLGIVCGLSEEAKVARSLVGAEGLVLCGSAAIQRLGDLVPADVTHLVSFGVCGALHPTLKVADVIIATAVKTADGDYQADIEWLNRLARAVRSIRSWHAPIWSGPGEEADTPDERMALFLRSGAYAIDDESAAVAKLAHDRGIKFAVVRPVSDDASANLPMAARGATNPDGSSNIDAVLAALRADPSQIFNLEKTAFGFEFAIQRLWDISRRVGKDFCAS